MTVRSFLTLAVAGWPVITIAAASTTLAAAFLAATLALRTIAWRLLGVVFFIWHPVVRAST
ncbi:MAG: hypothetical protein WCK27_23565 [Verrucomicrobiota bacterium]